MNFEFPQDDREAMEAKLTALLLGELRAEEIAEVSRAMEKDPQLAALYEQLKVTIQLVRETASSPAAETGAQSAPLKLSAERREKLLAQFKTVAPKEFQKPRRVMDWLIPWAAAAAIVMMLATLVLPIFSRGKSKSMKNSVINNLRMLDVAKQQWALDANKSGDAEPTMDDLKGYLGRGEGAQLPSIAGETYVPGKVSELPKVETSVAEAKKLFGKNALAGAEIRDGKVRVSLLPGQLAQAEKTRPAPVLADVPVVRSWAGRDSQAAHADSQMHAGLTREELSGVRYVTTNGVASQSISGEIARNTFDDQSTRNGGTRTAVPKTEIVLPPEQPPVSLADNAPVTMPMGGGNAGAELPAEEKKFEIPAVAVPTMPASSVTVDAKFVNVNSNDNRALGFDWYLANSSTNSTIVASSAGTTPSLTDKRKYAEYVAAKQDLENEKHWRKVLSMRTEQEGVDKDLPVARMVSIVDPATSTPTEKPGLGEKIREAISGKVERSARVQVEPGRPDVNGASGATVANTYGPYFLQTELETIRSEAVLKNVVERLKLDDGDKSKTEAAVQQLRKNLDLHPVKNSKLIEIGVRSEKAEDAARIANQVAMAYRQYRTDEYAQLKDQGIKNLKQQLAEGDQKIKLAQAKVDEIAQELNVSRAASDADTALPKPTIPPPVPQPEILTRENAFSTFSLNVSDVSFKLAAASLEKGQMPEPASIRSEEFINAFDYRDPDAAPGVPIAFASERAAYPFAHNRELLRFSLKTAAAGRQANRPLNIVLLLDNSGSMERADRVSIIREALRVLAAQLQPSDTFSIVTFARTARLRVDGVPGSQAAAAAEEISKLTPEGGTNLGDALDVAYETARHHYLANGDNRVVLLTDGAANLGDVNPDTLRQKVEAQRRQGIALDCFGIGWEGYNDDLLEVLTRHGDGRYGFINTPEEASTEFVSQIAGALHVAAADVKVQVEFNPKRVTSYRQIGYAKHQLTKEQFRDNTVDAAEIAAQEAGNALYTIETNPQGEGSIATVRVRYKVPGTAEYREQAWDVPYTGSAVALEQASPAMRLAATASAFSEWLATSPFAAEVSTDQLLKYLNGVPQVYGADQRPAKLEWMLRQAKSISGK